MDISIEIKGKERKGLGRFVVNVVMILSYNVGYPHPRPPL